MPTTEKWIDEQVLSTVWTAPLKSSEVSQCFAELTQQMESSEQIVHLLFDIEQAGSIPAQAPMHFIKSQIATKANLGSIAVKGTNPVAQIFAQMAVKMTGQNILFFSDDAQALEYLKSS